MFRSFELDPSNTFDAHQLIHFATTQNRRTEMVGRLFRANSRPPAADRDNMRIRCANIFHDGIRVGDRAKLVALAEEIGLTGAAEALESQRFADAVRADEAEAKKLGIGGVPFFLVDVKKAVSGAEAVDVLLQALG